MSGKKKPGKKPGAPNEAQSRLSAIEKQFSAFRTLQQDQYASFRKDRREDSDGYVYLEIDGHDYRLTLWPARKAARLRGRLADQFGVVLANILVGFLAWYGNSDAAHGGAFLVNSIDEFRKIEGGTALTELKEEVFPDSLHRKHGSEWVPILVIKGQKNPSARGTDEQRVTDDYDKRVWKGIGVVGYDLFYAGTKRQTTTDKLLAWWLMENVGGFISGVLLNLGAPKNSSEKS